MLRCNTTWDGIVNSEFGHRLYLTGMDIAVTEGDLRAFLLKYTEKAPVLVERVDMNTAFPAYVVNFQGLQDGQIQQFAERINGVYWRSHQLAVNVI